MFRTLREKWNNFTTSIHNKRIDKRTSRAVDLDESKEYDLLFLHQKGFIRARATGQSITQIYGKIENMIQKKLNVVISPGTYFVASSNCQNMVTRTKYSFTLYPCATENVNIKDSCINAGLSIPTEKDRFYGVRKVNDDLSRFLEASQNCDPMVVQAGIWTLTDNYTGTQVKNHLVSRDQYGRTHQAVTDANIAEAKRILDVLNIKHCL